MAPRNGTAEFEARSPRESFRVAGIPIVIDPSWFGVVALMSWSLSRGYFPTVAPDHSVVVYGVMGVVAAVLLFVCVLLHELGHSLVARAYGIPVARVKLFFFGGVAQIRQEPQRPLVELAVALAGPLVSGLLAFGCFSVARWMAASGSGWLELRVMLRYLATLNIALILFNLLPGFPLDGGRIMRATLWAFTGSLRQATRIASLVGLMFGVGLIVLGVWVILKGGWVGGLWYVVLGWFLRNAALVSYRAASPQRTG